MTGRSFTSMVLAAMGCGVPSFAAAQVSGPAAQVVTLPPEAGGFGGAYASPSFGDGGYGGNAYGGDYGGGGVMPAGGYGPACPPQDYPPACPPEQASGWPWKCPPLFLNPKLLKPPRGTFLRTEYLLWEIEKPGDLVLGAPRIEDNTAPLVTFFGSEGDNTATPGFPIVGGEFGYQPRLDEIQLRDNSGLRMTFGIPLEDYATFEGSLWLLEEASDHFEWNPRDQGTQFFVFNPVTSVKVNGRTGDDATSTGLFLINDRLEVDYQSDLWGADARFVVDALSPPGEGLKFRPLVGFKYVGLQEQMTQRGLFDRGVPFSSTIESNTDNTILGGTVGLRTELVHRWFVVGVEPAVTFAGNISTANVVTDRLTAATDPRTEVSADYFDFSPILDLKTYARVKVTEHMSLHVGYDAFWLSRVYRPARVIEYNVDRDPASGAVTPAFDTQREDDHVAVEGLSLGVEFVF